MLLLLLVYCTVLYFNNSLLLPLSFLKRDRQKKAANRARNTILNSAIMLFSFLYLDGAIVSLTALEQGASMGSTPILVACKRQPAD